MPRKPSAPAPQEPAVCAECFGTGYRFEGATAVPCNCGVADDSALARRLAASAIPERYHTKGFENFKTPTPALKEIRRTAAAWAETFDKSNAEGLLLRGGTGCGKTHLAVAILRRVIEGGSSGLYTNFTDLLTRLRESYNAGASDTEAEILDRVQAPDLLVLDDLGAENTSDWVRDRLYLIINRRYESQRCVIITSNCSIAELDQRLGKRTVSRLFEMCPVPFPPFPEGDWRRANMK